MCDCADELERKLRLRKAAGKAWSGGNEGAGEGDGVDGSEHWTVYWSSILGGAVVFLGIFGFLYKYYDLGLVYRTARSGLWKAFLDATCGGDATAVGGRGDGSYCQTRLHSNKRKYPSERSGKPFSFKVPGFSECPDEEEYMDQGCDTKYSFCN